MLRFAETPFSVHPEKDGTYLVKYRDWKTWGEYYAFTYIVGGGWNTSKSIDGTIYTDASLSPREMDERYYCWLKPVGEEWLTAWTYDQLIEELVVRCAMALGSKEQEMQANGATPGAIVDATYYLVKSIEYLKRMMSMLEGEIN